MRLVAFDFDGVFTDNSVYVSEDGTESVRCSRSDGIGLRKLENLGIQTIIISTEVNPVVSVRSKKLNIKCMQGVEDKAKALLDIAKDMSLELSQMAFVGNDINDLPGLKIVGLPIVVQDALPDVLPYAKYRTETPGGYGAVREVCDMFARVLGE
jgi:YrbI family 3-deoxy-D-manno-octulosonate 8-phosphate phosphatase